MICDPCADCLRPTGLGCQGKILVSLITFWVTHEKLVKVLLKRTSSMGGGLMLFNPQIAA